MICWRSHAGAAASVPRRCRRSGPARSASKAPCHATYHYVFQDRFHAARAAARRSASSSRSEGGLGPCRHRRQTAARQPARDEPRRAHAACVLDQAAGRRRLAGRPARQRRMHRGPGADQVAAAPRRGRSPATPRSRRGRSRRRSETGAGTTSCSSKATSRNCNPSSQERSETFPPASIIAAEPGLHPATSGVIRPI